MPNQSICLVCNAPFLIARTSGKPRKYCSPRCRTLAHRPLKVRITLEERYWRHVEIRGPDECWPWLGVTIDDGYGAFGMDGSKKMGGYQTTAHRVGLSLKLGVPERSIRKGCHTCDNPPCQNPAHLFDGTQGDNLADMTRKGRRGRTGPKGSGQLLDSELPRLESLRASGWSQARLANEFGVHQTTISSALRTRFKHSV